MRTVRLAVAVALATAGLAAPSSASGTASLVVDATGSAYVDVRFATPWTPVLWDVTTRGTYAYFGIRRHGSDTHVLQATRLAAWQAKGRPPGGASMTTGGGALPAGSYRVYVLSDNRAQGVLRFRGRGSMRVSASRAVTARAAYRPLSPLDAVRGAHRETFAHGRRTLAVLSVWSEGVAPVRLHLSSRLCLTPSGSTCSDPYAWGGGQGALSTEPTQGSWWEWWHTMTPRAAVLPPGAVDAVWESSPYGDVSSVETFLLTADLP